MDHGEFWCSCATSLFIRRTLIFDMAILWLLFIVLGALQANKVVYSWRNKPVHSIIFTLDALRYQTQLNSYVKIRKNKNRQIVCGFVDKKVILTYIQVQFPTDIRVSIHEQMQCTTRIFKCSL